MKNRHLAVSATLALLLAAGAQAQAPTPSFALLGYLQEIDVASLADPLSQGTLVVNGITVVLPRNLYITMPGQYLTANDLFRGPHPGNAGTALAPAAKPSGLALKDANRPTIPFEVDVIGNIVGDQYIAGVVHITQQGLNAGAGFVRSIDYAKGELLVGPKALGTPTARVRINDPNGVYGLANAAKTGGAAFDDRLGADPGNAPIAANTGFPMCIPRVAPPASDPLCPLANRAPAGGAFVASEGRRFTCGPIAAEPTAPAHTPCQPDKPAPLQEGDYITYNGMLTEDSPDSGTFFHAVHALQALAGIYTSPGANPAYVFIEEALIGTLGDPWPGIDQEETSRFRIVGFATDPSRRVDVFLVDPQAPNSERLLTTLQPSGVAQIGRIRVTLPAKANFLPITRDVRIRIAGEPEFTGSGLAQGQYTAPVGEYIYPENTRFGRPPSPVGVPFENFCFLKQGGERLATLGRDTLPDAARPVLGPLTPFPDSGHPNAQQRVDGTPACP